MPQREQFHPISVFRWLRERTAIDRAKQEYELWRTEHPVEEEILNLLDLEFHHAAAPQNPRRVRIVELAQRARRELGLGDHLVPYIHELPSRLEEHLADVGTGVSEEELKLLKDVNHGFWARAGFFTKHLREWQRPR